MYVGRNMEKSSNWRVEGEDWKKVMLQLAWILGSGLTRMGCRSWVKKVNGISSGIEEKGWKLEFGFDIRAKWNS